MDLFFLVSGYLVTASCERSPRFGTFLVKQARRIFPGLIACVPATVFALGPLLTVWPQAEYPVLLCTAPTLPLAALSWHLVEKPALAWQGRRAASAAEQAPPAAAG